MQKTTYEFGPFRLDVSERALTVEGQPVSIPPKELETLTILLENHGHIVDKHQLLNCVWPGVFVEEGNLARHVSYLRHRLAETDQHTTFIETIPKRGYRFIAPVTVIRVAAGLPKEAETLSSLFPSSPIYAGPELAGRIDFAEARMCSIIASFLSTARGLTPLIQPIAGGLAIFSAPRSPLNKVIGLGLAKDLDLSPLPEIEESWRARAEPVRVELSTLADPSVARTLSDRGYRLMGFENILGSLLSNVSAARTDGSRTPSPIEVELANDPTKLAAWVQVAVMASLTIDGTGALAEQKLERQKLTEGFMDASITPGFRHYVARVDGRAVGVGSLRIDRPLAQFAGGGTLPEFRGRGVQKALLQHRLQEARNAGCEIAVITAPPGSRSEENALRSGFALLYSRAIFLKQFDEPSR
jgi:DNA-binding winged helix-turn-helix (wHTH) protein/GNAT superfamily N-acetyltransferase